MFQELVEEDSIELQKVRVRNEQLWERFHKLDNDCKEIADRIINEQFERAKNHENVTILRKEVQALKTQCEQKFHELDLANDSIKLLTFMLNKTSSSTSKSVEKEKYLKELLDLRDQMIKCLCDECNDIGLNVAEKDEEIKELKQTVKHLEVEIDTLKKLTPDTVSRLQEELLVCKHRDSQIESKFRNIKMDLLALRLQGNHYSNHKKSSAKPNSPSYFSKSNSKIVEVTNKRVNVMENEVDELRCQVKSLEDKNKKLNALNQSQQNELAKLCNQIQNYKIAEESTSKIIKGMKSRVSELENKKASQLLEVAQTKAEKEIQSRSLSERLNRLQTENSPTKEVNLEKTIDELTTRILELKNEVGEAF